MFYGLLKHLGKAVFRRSYFGLEDSQSLLALTTYVEGAVINYILIRIKKRLKT
jgi:hypothetical protein